MPITMYHNPRCSKSRQALQLLRDNGVEPMIVEYLKTPPTKKELQRILRLLRMNPRELMRRKEKAYQEHELDNPALTRMELVEAMLEHPILMERPIVVTQDKAVIGRPPDKVLEIL